jgi:hypothetical protein
MNSTNNNKLSPLDPTYRFTFLLSPTGISVLKLVGLVSRTLSEVNKITRKSDQKNIDDLTTGYAVFKPSTVFSGSGGTFTSYVSDVYNWEGDQIRNAVYSGIYNTNFGKWWYNIPYLSALAVLWKGSLLDRGTAIDSLVTPENYPYDRQYPFPREHITATTRNVDTAVIGITSMTIDNPNSIFYNINNPNLPHINLSNYIRDQVDNYISYVKHQGTMTDEEYLQYKVDRCKFKITASANIPLAFQPVKPPLTVVDNDRIDIPKFEPLAVSSNISRDQQRTVAISNDYYSDAGTAGVTAYEAFIDTIQSTRSIYHLFFFCLDDQPQGNQNQNLFSNAFNSFNQLEGSYNEIRTILNIVSDNGRFYFGRQTDFEYVNGDLSPTPSKDITNDPIPIGSSINPQSTWIQSDFAVILKATGKTVINITGDTQPNIEKSFEDGYGNFRVTIIRRGAERVPLGSTTDPGSAIHNIPPPLNTSSR